LQQYDISQAVVWFEVEMDALVSVDLPCANEIYKSLPVRRDLAVVVDEDTTAQSLLDAMRDSGAPHVTELALFDLYRGKGVENGKKSLAFRVLLQDTEKTLIDSEIELSIAHLTAVLQKHGAQLRI
jgi:phenylalanyl-tRNA synthetase beta chain